MKRKDYCFKFAQMLNKLIFEKIVKHMQGNFCAKKEIDIILKNKRINIYKLIICLIMIIGFSLMGTENKSYAATIAGGVMSGELVLTEDTNLTSAISVSTGTSLTIDLNGFVLKCSNGNRLLIISNNATVTIKDSNPTKSHYGTITDNLWVYNASATSGIEIKGGVITGATTGDRGGAIFCSGNLIMNGGTIAGCKAVPNGNATENNMETYPVNTFTNGTGGAIYLNETATFEMNGGAIRYCKAATNTSILETEGGAVFIDSNADLSAKFTMNGGVISNCQATNGGAVYVHSSLYSTNTIINGASFTMTGGEISNCYASGSGNDFGGGAVFINATAATSGKVASIASFNMTGGEIKLNTTSAMGGAIYSLGKMNMSNTAKLSSNTTLKTADIINGNSVYTGFGGAVFLMNSDASFVMDGGTITNCIAASAGGVMAYTSSTFTMNAGVISNCSSYGAGGTGNGGAVYVQAATFNFNNGTLENCNAVRYGGAININQTANLYLNGYCNILNNTASHGGGISQEAGNCQIKLDNENILIKGNTATGNGGGLFVEKGILDISACTIENNQAGNNGGGISLRVERIGGDITLNMTGGIIRNNAATVNGGGIDIFADYTFTADDKTDDENKKNDVVVNLKNGIISNNTADGNGAGINVAVNEANGTANVNLDKLNDTQFIEMKQNTALKNGGGICVTGGNINIKNGDINNCQALNGGAVYVSGGNVDITGGTVKNSKATSGGGLYISNGNITMNGGNISNNQAEEYGGGIYAASEDSDLKVTILSGTVSGNIASLDGGGIGVNTGIGIRGIITIGLEMCKDLDKNHSHPVITDNTANENGGGFWLNGDDMTMNMYCGSIRENIAVLEPGSANIYQTGGNATVYAGEVGEGVIVIGGEYVYIPDNQIPEITITYDSNNPDNSEQKNALVTIGVEIFLPKNLFKREGYVLAGWAHNPNPTTNDTIYTVGEPYLVGDENVTVYAVWLLEGIGTIETPGIRPGKCFDEVTNGTNIILASNSSFTTQMSVLEIQPNYYTNRTLSFDKVIPNGTYITMIDCCDTNKKEFYYYKVKNNETKTIELAEFTKNGTTEKYVNPTTTELVDEKFLFVVELPKDNEETGARQITLIRNSADSEVAAIEQTTTYTMTSKREFELSYSNESGLFEKPTIESTINIFYSSEESIGDDTRYEGMNVALIIEGVSGNTIPSDAQIFDGTNYYNQNGKGMFVIPLGNIDDSKEVSFQLISNTLKANQIGANLKVELLASVEENNPGMGEVVAEIESIELNAIELPAIKIELDKNSYNQEEFSENLKLGYETKKLDDYEVTLELQKKVSSNSYVTQTNLLSSVNENSENTNGVFELDLNSSGNIDLEFVDGFENQTGTYRILLKASDTSGNEIEVPCNFMLME